MPRAIQFDPTASFSTNNITAATNTSAVSLYLPFDSNVNDASANGHSVTATGGAGISSAQSKFGSNSALFDGSDDYLSVAANSDFIFSTENFTIELFIYPNNDNRYMLLAHRASSATGLFTLEMNRNTTGDIEFFSGDYSGSTPLLSTTISGGFSGAFHHIAITRSDNVFRLFFDGVLKNSAAQSVTFSNITAELRIGADNHPTLGSRFFLNGYVDDLRITKGIALYYQNFVPPSQAVGASLSGANETNTTTDFTSLKLNLDSNFTDTGPSGHSMTANGNTQISTAQKQFGAGSALFDGNGDYLSTPASSDFAIGSGDFTVSLWYYPISEGPTNGNPHYSRVFNFGDYWNNTDAVVLMDRPVSGNGKFVWQAYSISTAYHMSSTTSVSNGQWYHLQICRSGRTFFLFVNGNLEDTYTSSVAITTSANVAFHLAGAPGGSGAEWSNSYIDDVLVLKGFALNTSSFTPPSSPLTTTVSQTRNDMTVLYIPFDDASPSDQARNYPVTATGDATLSTSVKKFGTSSASFDGTGDSFLVSDTAGRLRFSGDFTIECQVYPTTSGQDAVLGYHGSSGTSGWILQTGYNSSGGSSVGGRFYTNSGGLILNTSAININTWSHVAITRSGSTVRLFVNGSLEDSGTFATQLGPTGGAQDLRIGGSISASTQPFQGYIDDLRIIDGHAVYTAAFTAPTAAVGLAVVNTVTDTRTYASVFSLRSQYTEKAAGNWPTLPLVTATVQVFGAGGAGGAQNAGGDGGNGGIVKASKALVSGTVLKIVVGNGGVGFSQANTGLLQGNTSDPMRGGDIYADQNNQTGGQGGSGSGVFVTSVTHGNAQVVAGGGGGGAGNNSAEGGDSHSGTGASDSLNGSDGTGNSSYRGRGATTSAGGSANGSGSGAGAALLGGYSGTSSSVVGQPYNSGGSGGGGYYGGSGAGHGGGAGQQGGGGAGSGYVDATWTRLDATGMTPKAGSSNANDNPADGADGAIIVTDGAGDTTYSTPGTYDHTVS